VPLSVLIVDESPVMRQVIHRALCLARLPIDKYLSAENGDSAFEILASQKVDLILTDTQMTPMSGEEFADRLQKDACLRKIPFVVISADGTATSVQHMLDRGACAYLAKPFTAATLRSEVARALPYFHD
jgi:CheY-like chemotaxis protein